MKNKDEIVVTDWIKKNLFKGEILKLTLSSDQRKILRGKESDCNQVNSSTITKREKLNDGDILKLIIKISSLRLLRKKRI